MMDVLPNVDLRPYAGLWIAVVDGRIAGVGRSARTARLAAKRSRPKDDPIVLRVSDDGQEASFEDVDLLAR
jgi:hypothetical protein